MPEVAKFPFVRQPVLYFDKRLGATLPKRWSNSSFLGEKNKKIEAKFNKKNIFF